MNDCSYLICTRNRVGFYFFIQASLTF